MKIVASLGDNLHEVSNPISRKNKKIISKCRLLKFLPSLQCVKTTEETNSDRVHLCCQPLQYLTQPCV